MIFVLDPVLSGFTILWHVIKVQSLQLLAVLIIYENTSYILQQTEFNLDLDLFHDRYKLILRNFECLWWYIAKMSESLLDTLPELLLLVLLLLREGLGAIQHPQVL